MDDSSKTVFQLGADSLGTILHPRQHSQAVSTQTDESQVFLKRFRSSLKKTSAYLGENTPEELIGLIEDARFSDPVGNVRTVSVEHSLCVLAKDMERTAEQGKPIPSETIKKTRRLLEVREIKCLDGKGRSHVE